MNQCICSVIDSKTHQRRRCRNNALAGSHFCPVHAKNRCAGRFDFGRPNVSSKTTQQPEEDHKTLHTAKVQTDRKTINDITSRRGAFNNAIMMFGPVQTANLISQFYDTYKKPVVSIGSGMAYIEYLTMHYHPEVEFVCIDPTPQSFKSHGVQPLIAPNYPTVNDLIANYPDIVSECLILLNWCWPDSKYGDYDYHAIEYLQPIAVLSTFETIGAAGGPKFHAFISDFVDNHMALRDDDKKGEIAQVSAGYDLIHNISIVPEKRLYELYQVLTHPGYMELAITWLQRIDITTEPDTSDLPEFLEM